MARAGPEVADIFRRYGEAYRQRHGASLSTAQRRVMTAIELCRTAALGGHVEKCDHCDHQRISYSSCIMGKFGNGESTTDSVQSACISDGFTLHYDLFATKVLKRLRHHKVRLQLHVLRSLALDAEIKDSVRRLRSNGE